MIWPFSKSRVGSSGHLPQVPEGLILFAIGDIHGRVDLLRELHEKIIEEIADKPEDCQKVVLYVGDYIDRGLNSFEVIDLLTSDPLPGFEGVFLMGNHEEMLIRFLQDPTLGDFWFSIGGKATALSYIGQIRRQTPEVREALGSQDPGAIHEILRDAIPLEHLKFFAKLKLSHEVGDYFFVHAGIKPGIEIEDQTPRDLLWIRDEFIKSKKDHGKVVVHGHSISHDPELCPNRINVDTGAFATNNLTCLVLEGATQHFISTRAGG